MSDKLRVFSKKCGRHILVRKSRPYETKETTLESVEGGNESCLARSLEDLTEWSTNWVDWSAWSDWDR